MADAGMLEVRINVKSGNLLPIAKAFGVMSAALAAYGHEFSDDDQAVIAAAAELLADAEVECLPLPPTTHEGCQHA